MNERWQGEKHGRVEQCLGSRERQNWRCNGGDECERELRSVLPDVVFEMEHSNPELMQT